MPVPHREAVRELHELLDELLAALVRGVGLAGDHDLHRPLGIGQQLGEPDGVVQHQGEALVRRHPAGEPDRQDVRVEDVVDPAELGDARATGEPRCPQPLAGLDHEPRAQHSTRRPDLGVGDGVQTGAVGPGLPGLDLARDPGGRVHAVGHRRDRHLVGVERGPEPVEHPPADDAVELRHAVGALGQPQPHHGHVEDAGVAASVGLGAERQDALGRDAGQRVVAAEVLRDEVAREAVDAGGDGRVRGEERAGSNRLDGGLERESLLVHELADALDAEEPGVPLVRVEHLRLRAAGQRGVRPDRLDAAHAEQELLEQPVLAAAAVQPVRDVALGGFVVLDVGVQEQQRHPADRGLPDLRVQGATARQRQGDPQRAPGLVGQQRQRQAVGVADGVGLELPALAGQRLPEVAAAVEQPDPDDGHPEVAGGLEVVTGEDPEAPGVLREHRGDAELGREVADGRGRRLVVPATRSALAEGLVPPGFGQVGLEVVVDGPQLVQETLVGRELGEPLRRDLTEQAGGVVLDLGPDHRVHRREHVTGLRVPDPAQVHHQVAQRSERLWQRGADSESADGTHG